jgi:DNA primase
VALISEKVIEEIRLANDIVDVIGSYIPLKKAGANFRALCPFHKEKTPSFNVSSQRQIFKCFGCGVGGNVFHFVMRHENVEFVTSVKMLAERAGIKLQFSDQPRDDAAEAQKDLLYRLHDEVCSFYQNQLHKEASAQVARDYLTKRAVTADMAKLWRIGYAPHAWDATLNWGHSRKYTSELLELAGLIKRREEGSGWYDRFRGRLMFPICNEQGRVVGFSGRVLDAEAKEAKYVNSPDTPIFNKSRILFGLDKSKRAILDAKHAIVCEGQLDTIACYQAGVENVVAPQGTAFTESHARILKRYVDEVVLCFDSDSAGQNAAARSFDVLIESGLLVRVAELPKGDDPDSLVRTKGADALKAVLGNARSYFDFHLDWLCRQHDPQTDMGKITISRAAAELLVKVPNAALQASYMQKVAGRLGVREEEMREEMRKMKQSQRPVRAEEGEPIRQETLLKKIPPAEKMLLELMLADKEVVAVCAQRLDAASLGRDIAADYIREIIQLHARGLWKDAGVLLGGNRTPEQIDLISEVLLASRPEQDFKKLALDCLQSLEKAQIQAQIEVLAAQLAQPGLSFEKASELQKQIQTLDIRRRLTHISPLPIS